MKIFNQKIVGSWILGLFLIGQVAFISTGLFLPKVAQADLASTPISGIASLATVPTSDMPTVYERILIGIARTILQKFTEHFLTKFVNQLTNKYKIRNFLYYDEVLVNYYLNRYIADRVTDPDLKRVYTLLYSAKVTGAPTGTTGGPDPRKALIPRIKQAMADYYINQGGIDSSKVYNPAPGTSDIEYFQTAQAYFSNPPSFTEQNLQGQFGAFQSLATTGAQAEIALGNGLKAGRVIGGVCANYRAGPYQPDKDPTKSPENCRAAGGTWQASALDQARSFIDNPSTFVKSHLDSAIMQHFNNNFNPSTDFWTQVGSAVGSYIWNQLGLDKSGGTLPDSPDGYQGSDLGAPAAPIPGQCSLESNQIDVDGDCISDGVDYDGDGLIDICSYGGSPPDGCVGSKVIITPPTSGTEGPTCVDTPGSLACNSSDHSDVVTRVKAYVVAQVLPDGKFNTLCDVYEITRRVAWALRGEGTGLLTTQHTTQCNGYSADVIAYSDNSQVDILSDAGPDPAKNTPKWQPMPPSSETTVRYYSPSDPGDPAGSY